MGDRMCPSCNEIGLVEESLTVWKCLNCGEEFDEKFLDDGIEID